MVFDYFYGRETEQYAFYQIPKILITDSKDGIVCIERSDVGGKSSERELWSLSYGSSDDFKKVQGFLRSFTNDERLTFATQESFWEDFLQDDFDIEGFRAFYNSTDNGRIDIEKTNRIRLNGIFSRLLVQRTNWRSG